MTDRNKIKPRRSFTSGYVPTSADLDPSELAINWADGKAFTKDSAGQIVSVTMGGGSGSGSLSGSVTIPASGDEYWTSTVLLLKGDGNLTDSSSYGRTVTAYGNAAANGAAKFGTNSFAFDGSGDYLDIPASADFDLGTISSSTNWTAECWVKPAGSFADMFLLTHATPWSGGNDIGGWSLRTNETGAIEFAVSATNTNGAWAAGWRTTSTSLLSSSQWTHVAVVISAGVPKIVVNGTEAAGEWSLSGFSGRATSFIGLATTRTDYGVRIGATYQNGANYSGLIDDVRITRAARAITVPTATYATGTYTAAQTLPVTITGSGGGGSGLAWSSVPASATATGTAGQIAYDGDYIYVATAANTWERAALSTWTPFTPASVTGLQAWYDASDASTLYDATSGGSLVAADGSVARWEDKSGNGRHFTQSTSGSRPQRKTSQQNGLAVLRLDGTDDFMSVPSSTAAFKFLHSVDSTLFVVLTRSATAESAILHTGDGGTGTVGFNLYFYNGSSTNDRAAATIMRGVGSTLSAAADFPNSTFSAGWSVVSSVMKPTDSVAANRISLRKNGGSVVATNTHTNAVSTANSTYDLTLGKFPPYAGFTHGGDIAEVVIYNTALSDTDRAAVEQHLMSKWGIS